MIQSRYGWTDREVLSLSAFRFLEIAETIQSARTREEKENLIHGAFIGWQLTEFLKGMFSKKAKGTPFNKYLKNFNLLEKTKTTKQQREAEVDRKIKQAEKIKARDQRRK